MLDHWPQARTDLGAASPVSTWCRRFLKLSDLLEGGAVSSLSWSLAVLCLRHWLLALP